MPGSFAVEEGFSWNLGKLREYVLGFVDLPPLVERIVNVLAELPADVLDDLLHDPCFRLALDSYVPGRGRTVLLASPTGGNWKGSRCVVLKHRLAECAEEFAHYVIAHEFAHAFLWNGGWGEITDREAAADALAAHWGFPAPDRWS
jgi:hypothetical protein